MEFVSFTRIHFIAINDHWHKTHSWTTMSLVCNLVSPDLFYHDAVFEILVVIFCMSISDTECQVYLVVNKHKSGIYKEVCNLYFNCLIVCRRCFCHLLAFHYLKKNLSDKMFHGKIVWDCRVNIQIEQFPTLLLVGQHSRKK